MRTTTATTIHRPRARRPRRGRAGAVFVETLVMLPFFVIVFGCILWVHGYYSQRIQLSSRAKACAWIYANGGCSQLPAECIGPGLGVASGSAVGPDLLPGSGGGDVTAFARLAVVQVVLHGVPDITIGQPTRATNQGSVSRPAVLGGGAVLIFSSQSVMCNRGTDNPGMHIREVFCALTNLC